MRVVQKGLGLLATLYDIWQLERSNIYAAAAISSVLQKIHF